MGIFAFGLERLGLVGIKAPVVSLLVLTVATTIAVSGLLRITFDDDLNRLFKSPGQVYSDYERLRDAFPALENQMLVVAESERAFSREQLDALRNLHIELRFVPGVDGVVSLFTLRTPSGPTGQLHPVFPAELPNGSALEALIDEARGHPHFSDRLLSNDGRSALVLIGLSKDVSGSAQTQDLLNAVDALAQDVSAKDELRLSISGSIAIRHAIKRSLQSDLYVLTVLGLLIAVGVCALFFRRLSLVVLASLPSMVSVVWVIGGFGLAGIPITTLNNILPTLVLVIAFADSVHMVQAIRRKTDRGIAPAVAAREAVFEVGPACAMTTVTTMIACLSLTLSDAETVREFALAGTIAIFSAFLSVITLVPSLTVLLLKTGRPDDTPAGRGMFNAMLNYLVQAAQELVQRRWPIIAAASLPLLLTTALLYFKVGTDHDYRAYLTSDSQVNQVIDHIDAKLGGANAIHILVEKNSGSPDDLQNAVEALHAVEVAVAANSDFRSVMSLATVSGKVKQDTTDPAKGYAALIDGLPTHIGTRLISKNRNAFLVTAFIPAVSAIETRRTLNGLEASLDPVRKTFPEYHVMPTGIIAVSAFASERMINGLKLSLAAAVVATFLVIAISLRSGFLALISTVPNLLSLTIVAAALYLIGSALQIVSVLALTIAFGIAVDNTIHLLNRYSLERAGTGDLGALEACIGKVGPVLIATTIILSLGFAVTQFSALPMVTLFGRLCVFVLCTALIVALLVLPSLMMFFQSRVRRS